MPSGLERCISKNQQYLNRGTVEDDTISNIKFKALQQRNKQRDRSKLSVNQRLNTPKLKRLASGVANDGSSLLKHQIG